MHIPKDYPNETEKECSPPKREKLESFINRQLIKLEDSTTKKMAEQLVTNTSSSTGKNGVNEVDTQNINMMKIEKQGVNSSISQSTVSTVRPESLSETQPCSVNAGQSRSPNQNHTDKLSPVSPSGEGSCNVLLNGNTSKAAPISTNGHGPNKQNGASSAGKPTNTWSVSPNQVHTSAARSPSPSNLEKKPCMADPSQHLPTAKNNMTAPKDLTNHSDSSNWPRDRSERDRDSKSDRDSPRDRERDHVQRPSRHTYYGMQNYYSSNPWPKSSIFSALQKFYKNSEISFELNNLVIKYIAKTGDLPILSTEELALIPKLKFGQHLYKMSMSGFVRASSNSGQSSGTFGAPQSIAGSSSGSGAHELSSSLHPGQHSPSDNKENIDTHGSNSTNNNSASSSSAHTGPFTGLIGPISGPGGFAPIAPSSSSGRSSKLSMVSSDSEMDDSDDELTVFAWKETYMKQYGMDINENDTKFKSATNKVIHNRKIWKIVQSVIEKKILTTIDEYNRNYNYEKTEKKRCESKNCEYLSFMAFKKSIHRRFVTYFDDMPPFTLQRICELLDSPLNKLKNCGKYMRALEKNLQVTSYWQPFGYSQLLDETEGDDMNSDGNEDDEEDRTSIFNDTASMHSISKHSWHSRSIQSPRSVGSQSPYHTPGAVIGDGLDADSELASIIRDVGPGCPPDMMNRVPSPIGMAVLKQASDEKKEGLPINGPSTKRPLTENSYQHIPSMSPPKKQKTDQARLDIPLDSPTEALKNVNLDKDHSSEESRSSGVKGTTDTTENINSSNKEQPTLQPKSHFDYMDQEKCTSITTLPDKTRKTVINERCVTSFCTSNYCTNSKKETTSKLSMNTPVERKDDTDLEIVVNNCALDDMATDSGDSVSSKKEDSQSQEQVQDEGASRQSDLQENLEGSSSGGSQVELPESQQGSSQEAQQEQESDLKGGKNESLKDEILMTEANLSNEMIIDDDNDEASPPRKLKMD